MWPKDRTATVREQRKRTAPGTADRQKRVPDHGSYGQVKVDRVRVYAEEAQPFLLEDTPQDAVTPPGRPHHGGKRQRHGAVPESEFGGPVIIPLAPKPTARTAIAQTIPTGFRPRDPSPSATSPHPAPRAQAATPAECRPDVLASERKPAADWRPEKAPPTAEMAEAQWKPLRSASVCVSTENRRKPPR